MSFLAYKYGLNFDNLTKDLQEFCSEEKENLFTYTIEDDYKNFIDLMNTIASNENDGSLSINNVA